MIKNFIKKDTKVMVFLDSNHTYSHVKKEIELYSKLVTKNSYLVVEDSFSEFFPKNHFKNRPVDVGNNPMIAIKEFLKKKSLDPMCAASARTAPSSVERTSTNVITR